MSIIDLIKEQKLLTITLGMALMPLVLAALMAVFVGLRRGFKALKEHRETVRARKQAAIEEAKQLRKERKAAALKAKKQRRLEQLAALDAENANEIVEEAPESSNETAVETGSEEDEEQDDEEQETSGEMQALLDSVFGSEEQDERYKILLEGIDEININELANFAESVAEQLHKAS